MDRKPLPNSAAAGGPDRVSGIVGRVARRYTVYPAEAADRAEIVAFLKAAYAGEFNAAGYRDEKKISDRWEWANCKNPYAGRFRSVAWICRENGSKKIVGHFGVIPVLVRCNGRDHPAVWGRDLIVLPAFRQLGVGPFLVASVLKEMKDQAALFLIAGVREHVYPMYQKFGFTDIGFLPLYARVNRIRLLVDARVQNQLCASLLSACGAFAMAIVYAPSRLRRLIRRIRSPFSITEITSFGASFDALWDETADMFGASVRRDAAYLTWRFVEQPYWKYTIFMVSRKGCGDPAGYVVVREGMSQGLRTGIIADIVARRKEPGILMALVDHALSYFAKRRDLAAIRCDVLDADVGRVLKRCGFVRAPSRERFMFTNSSLGAGERFLSEPGNWFLDYSDSDLDLSGQAASRAPQDTL